MRLPALLIGFALCQPASAFAEWREASSEHFVIYANNRERDLRNFSEKLERYHSAMKALFPTREITISPSNRVTIYVVGGRDLRSLFGDGQATSIQGFYTARAGGSIAFALPLTSSRGSELSESERVLLHEYAHHFMAENAPYLVPRWFTEGFAEYFSSARFGRDGSAELGLAANHRVYEFTMASEVSIEELLDAKAYAARRARTYNDFYARSWLLFHYLYSNVEGRRKLADYLIRLNRGEGELDAAVAVFGDLEELDDELDDYRRGSRIQAWKIENLAAGPVVIRELGAAEAAAIPIRMRSKRGVTQEQAADLVVDARQVAAIYPEEPEAQAMLAEAEFDAGNDEAALAAADRALTANPAHINALIQKGYALFRIATETGSPESWTQARRHFLAINKVEADHPIPLLYYYLSFTAGQLEPTQNAIEGLEWALHLAPYDANLRMTAASQQMQDERFEDAIQTLGALAYDPHVAADHPAVAMLEAARQALAAQSSGEPEQEAGE